MKLIFSVGALLLCLLFAPSALAQPSPFPPPGGNGAVTVTTGVVNPTTGVKGTFYVNTTAPLSLWFFYATNTPRLIFSSTGTGTFAYGGAEGPEPADPDAGDIICWLDETSHLNSCKGSAGTISAMVQSKTCGAGEFFDALVAGVFDCAAAGGGGAPLWVPFIGSQVSASCAAAGVLISNGISPTCPPDTATAPFQGYGLWFEDAGTHNSVIVSVPVPSTYAGAAVAVGFYFEEHGGHNTFQFAVESLFTNINGTAFGSFNAAQNFTSTTTTGAGMNVVTITSVTSTGFVAKGQLLLRFTLANNPNGFVNAIGASVQF